MHGTRLDVDLPNMEHNFWCAGDAHSRRQFEVYVTRVMASESPLFHFLSPRLPSTHTQENYPGDEFRIGSFHQFWVL